MKFLFSLHTLSHSLFTYNAPPLSCKQKSTKKGGVRDITRFNHTLTSTNAPGSQVSFARTVTLKKLLLLSYMVTHNRLDRHNNKITERSQKRKRYAGWQRKIECNVRAALNKLIREATTFHRA